MHIRAAGYRYIMHIHVYALYTSMYVHAVGLRESFFLQSSMIHTCFVVAQDNVWLFAAVSFCKVV